MCFVRTILLSILLVFCGSAQINALESSVSPADIVVKILSVRNPASFHQPWQKLGRHSVNGTGFIVTGGRILTNAHVVSDAVFIHVRRAGKTEKFPAEVEFFDHESDLALLSVEDKNFFKGTAPLDIGDLPQVRDKVAVYGFPDGGDKLSITEGVVSRIEHISYSYSGAFLLACQIDASVNTGNSGGPVILKNKIVGVAFQGMDYNYDNIGFMIPAPVIKQFLKDAIDGEVNGIPDLGLVMQKLESPYLRKFYQLQPGENGALINKVLPGSPAEKILRPDDVLLAIEGQDVAYDGTIEFRKGHRTFFGYTIQQKQIGTTVEFEIKRAGKNIRVNVPLLKSLGFARLVPSVHEKKPRYYILGGLVFQPLTLNYLYEFGGTLNWYQAAPVELMNYSLNKDLLFQTMEIVLLSEVLADKVNIGYHELGDNVIKSIDGVEIKNFNHFVNLLETGSGQYIELKLSQGTKVILNRKAIFARSAEIIKKYAIKEDRNLEG